MEDRPWKHDFAKLSQVGEFAIITVFKDIIDGVYWNIWDITENKSNVMGNGHCRQFTKKAEFLTLVEGCYKSLVQKCLPVEGYKSRHFPNSGERFFNQKSRL